MAVHMRPFVLAIWSTALGTLFFCAASATAQPAEPAQTTLGQRIEAAAKAALNSPRLRGLTEQQRIDRVEFVAGNTLVLLSHKMGRLWWDRQFRRRGAYGRWWQGRWRDSL